MSPCRENVSASSYTAVTQRLCPRLQGGGLITPGLRWPLGLSWLRGESPSGCSKPLGMDASSAFTFPPREHVMLRRLELGQRAPAPGRGETQRRHPFAPEDQWSRKEQAEGRPPAGPAGLRGGGGGLNPRRWEGAGGVGNREARGGSSRCSQVLSEAGCPIPHRQGRGAVDTRARSLLPGGLSPRGPCRVVSQEGACSTG